MQVELLEYNFRHGAEI